jgi:hypothetical protein
VEQPSEAAQKHALSGFSSGVPNTSEGGTNLEMDMEK